MKRPSKETLQYSAVLLGSIAAIVGFKLLVDFLSNPFPTYLHVINHYTCALTLYSPGLKQTKSGREVGQIAADGEAWFPLASDVNAYHWRFVDITGQTVRDVTVSREQVQREKKYHHRFHGGSDDYDVVVEVTLTDHP